MESLDRNLPLHFDGPRGVAVTNLLERPQGGPVRAAVFQTDVHKHGILTVKIR